MRLPGLSCGRVFFVAPSKARWGRRARGVCGVRAQWYQSVEEWWTVARTRSLGWDMYWWLLKARC